MSNQVWRIFKSREDYERGMERLLQLAENGLQENTDEFDEFELLNLLIGHYEEKEFPMEKPDPIEAIKFRMDQQGLTQADMRQYIGSASKVSEVLNYKRPLSLSMIKRLHQGLGIPADILIQNTGDVEWSTVAYGAESLAFQFGETCRKLLEHSYDLEKDEDYQEIAILHKGVHFSAKQKRDKTINVVNVAGKFISPAAPLSLKEFQRA